MVQLVSKIEIEDYSFPKEKKRHKQKVHKLRLKDLAFFDHLPPFVNIFYGINVDKKWIFLDYLPMHLVL